MQRSTIREAADRGETLSGELIVDIHCHMGGYHNFWIRRGDAEGLVSVMNRVGVDVACPSHLEALGGNTTEGNEAVARAQEAYPGRFVPVMLFNPNYPEETPGELDRMARRGVRHAKIHSLHGVPYKDPAYDPAFEWAESRDGLVVAHTWGGEFLEQLAERARQHPGAKCVAVHAGSNNPDRYVGLARQRPNLWLEISYSKAPFNMIEKLVNGAGAEKVLYGSDMPFYSMTPMTGRILYARLSDDDKRKILGLNARELLGLH